VAAPLLARQAKTRLSS
jgi:hypothetical protein